MAIARQFSLLYGKVQTICQDQSSNGTVQAKDGVNTVIRELTKMFKMPQMFKGYDNSVFVTPSVGIGVIKVALGVTDLVSLSDVWWIDESEENWPLSEITNDGDWLSMTDNFSTGQPSIFRYFQQSSSNPQMQIWQGPNSAWALQSGGKLYFSYWAQLAQLVNDTDVPNVPYELDTVFINGGVVEMARQQGDDVLIKLYQEKYEDDLGEIRAWLIKLKTKDVQLTPDIPQGTFGMDDQSVGYRIVG